MPAETFVSTTQPKVRAETNILLDSGVEILLDALAVEDVIAASLDRVLGDVVAQPADDRLAVVVHKELALVVLAAEHEVWMARHLPHPRQETEDVRVVCTSVSIRRGCRGEMEVTVQDGPRVDIGAERALRIREEGQVELLLLRAEVILPDDHRAGRQVKVVRAFDFRAPQHKAVQQNAQLLEGGYAGANHSALLDRRQNLVVPEARLQGSQRRSDISGSGENGRAA
jgi:hypothetical protein